MFSQPNLYYTKDSHQISALSTRNHGSDQIHDAWDLQSEVAMKVHINFILLLRCSLFAPITTKYFLRAKETLKHPQETENLAQLHDDDLTSTVLLESVNLDGFININIGYQKVLHIQDILCIVLHKQAILTPLVMGSCDEMFICYEHYIRYGAKHLTFAALVIEAGRLAPAGRYTCNVTE